MVDAGMVTAEKSSRRRPFRAVLGTVKAYQPGMTLDAAERRHPGSDFAKLASNENLHGCSPKVYQALGAFGHLEIYPDPQSERLRETIGGSLGVDPGQVIMGAGSETLIDLAIRAVIDPGDRAVLSSPTFPAYASSLTLAGAEIVDVPRALSFDLDIDATAAALARPPKLLIVCTPNNPTGNAVSDAELRQLLKATPRDSFVLLDEAYHEFNRGADALPLLRAWEGHWLLMRTFSKAYALAGARVGYGVASSAEVVGYLDRLRPAFNLTALSQTAALAAWDDQAHMRSTVAMITAERERVMRALSELQVRHAPSAANFVLLQPRAPYLEAAERLLAKGLIVRPIPLGEDGWLRVTIGRPEQNDRVLEALPAAIGVQAS